MALIPCPGCGGTISDRAKTCPHCGLDMTRPVSAPEEAAKRCVECGTILSAEALTCPACGCPADDMTVPVQASAPAVTPAPPVTPAPAEPVFEAYSVYEAPEAEAAPAPEAGHTEPTLLVAAPAAAALIPPAPAAEPEATPAPIAEPAPESIPEAEPEPEPAPEPAPAENVPAARPANSLVSADAIFLEMPRPGAKWKTPPRMELVVADRKRLPVDCSKVYKIATPCATEYTLENADRRITNVILLSLLLVIFAGTVLSGLLCVAAMLSGGLCAILHPLLWLIALLSAACAAGLYFVPQEKLPTQIRALLKLPERLPERLRGVRHLLPLSFLLLAAVLFIGLIGAPAITLTPANFRSFYLGRPFTVKLVICGLMTLCTAAVYGVRLLFFKPVMLHFPVVPGNRFRISWADASTLQCEQLPD